MSVPTSAKTVTFTFTEDEATAYYDLVAARQSWGAQSGHGRAFSFPEPEPASRYTWRDTTFSQAVLA
jgi:hypothetical protein